MQNNNIATTSSTNNDSSVDSLLSMVDFGEENQTGEFLVREEVKSPTLASLQILINSWQECAAAGYLERIILAPKYAILLNTFSSKENIQKDSDGQYIVLDGQKVRPIDAHGRGFFYRAVSYRFESMS